MSDRVGISTYRSTISCSACRVWGSLLRDKADIARRLIAGFGSFFAIQTSLSVAALSEIRE
jgi:hypothetical protein